MLIISPPPVVADVVGVLGFEVVLLVGTVTVLEIPAEPAVPHESVVSAASPSNNALIDW